MFFNFGNSFRPDFHGSADDDDGSDDFPEHGNKDYYKILNVDEKAGEDEIKKAYRKLSMIHHPDKNGNTDESKHKFQEINQAYETLSKPNERRKYDMMRKFGNGGGDIGGLGGLFARQNGMGGGPGPNVEHIFHFGGPGGGGGGGGGGMGGGIHGLPDELLHVLFGLGGMGGMGGMGGPPGGPKVVFQGFHGNGGGGAGNGPRVVVQVQPPETIIKTISLSLEQSFTGCSFPLDIDRQIPDQDIVRIERETLHIQIPKGVLQGDTIILNECGNMNEAGMKGDIRILINILQHPIFKVEHLDLHIEKTITLKDALCGFNFEIQHLSGKVFQLSNKPGNIIKPDSIKTIPNLGIEKNGETGSIKIKFNVTFPESLTHEQADGISKCL